MTMRIENDNDRVSYMQLIYAGLISTFGTLTERGLASAIVYCNSSFYSYLESHPYMQQQYHHILEGCTTPEQVDQKALLYYEKRVRQL